MIQTILLDLESFLNSGSKPQYILNDGFITKGAVGKFNQYKFVVNSNDHRPPHVHISVNNKQIAKYSLKTGKSLFSVNGRLDELVMNWFNQDNNLVRAREEWQRFHGGKK